MKRMLITGGTGFIGSNLCKEFYDKYGVTSFSDCGRVSPLFNKTGVKNIKGSTSDVICLDSAIKYNDIVIHCAGITGIDKVLEDPYSAIVSNIQGIINVIDTVSRSRIIRHCIIFSSGEALGTNTKIKEGFAQYPLYDDRWCYGISKLVAEYLSLSRFRTAQTPITVVRPFNVYGPGQVGGGAIRTFILQALKNELITINGDGSQVRSWCYIDDFVQGIRLIVENPDLCIGKVFNIGNSQTVISILELAKLVVEFLNSKSQIDFVKGPFVDVEYRVPDITEISKLGFHNVTNLKLGILNTAEYFRNI